MLDMLPEGPAQLQTPPEESTAGNIKDEIDFVKPEPEKGPYHIHRLPEQIIWNDD